MTAEGIDWLSPDELLDGLPSRRASLLLFAIESRTAQLVASDQRDAALFVPPAIAEEREREFLQALAAGRDLPLEPKIQDIERFAEHWRSLVPEDAGVRAAVAHMLGEKHTFTQQDTARLQAALSLTDAAVQQAHQRYYQQPLDAIYAPQVTLGQRLRWGWAGLASRLEALPPFWVAFFLTLPGAAGLLAMPIALSSLGPGLGVGLLILFGVINLLTVAGFVEAVTRSTTARFGLGFFGQLAQEYLGNAGSLLVTVILALNNFLVLIVFYMGVAGTLEGATKLPSELWIAVIFTVGLVFLFKGSFNATVSSTLLVVMVDFALLLIIPALSLPHFRLANLTAQLRPFSAQGFAWIALAPVFGVLLSTYFSHIVVPAYGPVVLRRDPGGRALLRGASMAILVFMGIACLWMVVVNGAIPPEVLRNTAGTVITPLAALIGPVVSVLGSLLVVLSLGLASIQVALGLYYLVQERIPARSGAGRWTRFVLGSLPVVAVFLISEWMAISNSGSFTNLLGVLSAFALPVLAGVLPLLLLLATRRKGDFVPQVVVRWLGNPVVVAALYLFFVGAIFLYGLLIFPDWPARLTTLAVGVLVLVVTVVVFRRGVRAPRLSVGVHEDQDLNGRSAFYLTSGGTKYPWPVTIQYTDGKRRQHETAMGELPDFAQLRNLHTALPADKAKTLKVWALRTTAGRQTVSLPSSLVLGSGQESMSYDLPARGGQIVVPLTDETCDVDIRLFEN